MERSPGTIYAYLAMNLRDPILRDVRVRQALAHAIDRRVHHPLPLRDHGAAGRQRPAAPALGLRRRRRRTLTTRSRPPIARRCRLPAGPDGVRFHFTMKTSTEESTRLLAAVLQQQLREVGIALDIRSFEFATFYADITKGTYQLHSLRWVGGNHDPDIFEHIFATASFAPKRANRTFYSNPRSTN